MAAARFLKRMRIVANHVEHPEHGCRSAQMARQLSVTAAYEVHKAIEVARVADVSGRKCPPFNEIQRQNSGLGIHNRRTEAGRMRGSGRRKFVASQNAVNRNVGTDPNDHSPSVVGDQEILVGDAAGEGDGFHRPRPNAKLRHAATCSVI